MPRLVIECPFCDYSFQTEHNSYSADGTCVDYVTYMERHIMMGHTAGRKTHIMNLKSQDDPMLVIVVNSRKQ